VIVLSVRWYLRFGLSYRDVEELLAEAASTSTTWQCCIGGDRVRAARLPV